MTHDRDNFSMMDAVTSFGKKNHLSLSKSLAFVLALLFIGCLVGTGLLVYHLSSCTSPSTKVVEQVEICGQMPYENFSTTTTEVREYSTTTTVDPVTTTVPKEKIVDIRLPRSILPDAYDVKLIPFILEGNFTFKGEITIRVNVTEAVSNITLHSDELEINQKSITVNDLQNNTFAVEKIENDTERQFLIIFPKEKLQAGQYDIYIEFKGILNDQMQGFYRSSYNVETEVRWIAATQFQATDARRAFPCFDEPAMKAKFKISLARFKNMSSISNMPKVLSKPVDGLEDYEWDVYQESIPMSTYLVAFVVSDFVSLKSGNFSVWVRQGAQPQARYSLEIGPKVLKFYEDFFQIKFPLPKVDMIALPDFAAGAMENWGLVTYRETAMLYEEGVSSRSSLQRVTSVIAHELAHQWFGNLVTPRWWTDIWLNEGFASYMEYIGTDAVQPDWKVMDQFVVLELQNVFSLDVLKSSHPVSIKVNNPVEINDIFDRISYSKGATIIRMMEYFLTSEVFRRGLTNYLTSRMYSSAEQDDLWHALTEQAHKDGTLKKELAVKQIMDTWTLQTGFPLVTVTRSYDSKFISFKQERFLIGSNRTDPESSLWWIPLTYVSKDDREIKSEWLPVEPEIVLTDAKLDKNEWLLVNIDQRGYYRVNYDNKNWQLLTQQLLDKNGFKNFSSTNRAQLLDDSLNLAAAGFLDYDIALNLTRYLTNERDCVPWMTAFIGLDYIQEMFMKTADFDKLKLYLSSLLKEVYAHVGFEDSPKDSQLTVYNRMEVLWRACLLGNIDCIRNAVTYFHNWRTAPNSDQYNPISPNQKNVVYCVAIRAGGQEEWEFAWERYQRTNVGSEKETILSALGCSRDTWILSRYLYWAITEGSGIRKQDAPRVFAAVANNIIGQDLTYKFFKNNWALLKKSVGSSLSLLNSIVKACISHINTQEELNDLKTFVRENVGEFSVVAKTIEQSIEQVEGNVRWMNSNYDKIVRWLARYQRSHDSANNR
ncbi:hypothetical protein PPYR_06158 [Photinus pyralis]|uniref:Aminopeptidase n=2 Tax=Photinus pyralis TaxID=7054 RepID=A0A1Y1L923_PHOPY|nr:aminopeptidase N [Photinus pyralis]XP_031337693.1 aminopeptidase N [Photinus pyralis]XP_031337694.1 aminopeptidase N [Photinus pyralis]KAB0800418.1 hypothetical protein PPYR_06158 [Photinus pyralis]